jgi:hypothetical protein
MRNLSSAAQRYEPLRSSEPEDPVRASSSTLRMQRLCRWTSSKCYIP